MLLLLLSGGIPSPPDKWKYLAKPTLENWVDISKPITNNWIQVPKPSP